MLEQSKPAVKLLSHSSPEKFMSKDDVTIVGFFESDTGSLYETFVDAAERTRGDFSCYFVKDLAVIKEFRTTTGKIIIFYPKVFFNFLLKFFYKFSCLFQNMKRAVRISQMFVF